MGKGKGFVPYRESQEHGRPRITIRDTPYKKMYTIWDYLITRISHV